MYRIVICGTGRLYNKYVSLIKMHEINGEIKVIGVISNEIGTDKKIDGYPIYSPQKCREDYDYCILAQEENATVLCNVSKFFPRNKIIPIRVFSIPYFNFRKYIHLKENPISLITSNCWGGFCYHYLGLEFCSPTINLFFNKRQFNEFANNLDYYLNVEVAEHSVGFDNFADGKKYPIGKLDDILVYFNHYKSFDDAKSCWDKRRKRVNKDNFMFISFSDDIECINEFEEIKHKNKYIFVPSDLEINTQSIIPIKWENKNDSRTIAMYANGYANGNLSAINILSLLCGEKDFMRTI